MTRICQYIKIYYHILDKDSNIDKLNNISALKPELELNIVKLYNISDETSDVQ